MTAVSIGKYFVLPVLFLALAIILGVLLLPACAVLPVVGVLFADGCPSAASLRTDQAVANEQARTARLERELSDLQLALLDDEACALPPPAPEEEVPPPVEDHASCPPRRPTDVVLLLDVSNSMKWNYDADPAMIAREEELYRREEELAEQLNALRGSLTNPANFAAMARALQRVAGLQQQLNSLGSQLDAARRALAEAPGPDRIDVARDAIERLVREAPDDVSFSALRFAPCGPPHDLGQYPPNRRNELISRFRSSGLQGNTALGQAIAGLRSRAGGARSPENPVNVVLFSDGAETCGHDPCAAARALKAEFPYLYINVVAIGAEALDMQRCIAEATGGQFLAPESAEELGDAMQSAAGQEEIPGCRAGGPATDTRRADASPDGGAQTPAEAEPRPAAPNDSGAGEAPAAPAPDLPFQDQQADPPPSTPVPPAEPAPSTVEQPTELGPVEGRTAETPAEPQPAEDTDLAGLHEEPPAPDPAEEGQAYDASDEAPDTTGPDPAPEVPPAAEPPMPTEHTALSEPEQAGWETGEISAIAGCWSLALDHPLAGTGAGGPHRLSTWKVCLDESGAGTQTMTLADGSRCESPVAAVFDPPRLQIDDPGDVPCDGGAGLLRRSTECFLDGAGKAVCWTLQLDDPYGIDREVPMMRIGSG